MARPQTFSKKENEKKKQARKLEKQNRKEERKLFVLPDSFLSSFRFCFSNLRACFFFSFSFLLNVCGLAI